MFKKTINDLISLGRAFMISDETPGAQTDFALNTLVPGSGFAGFHVTLPDLLVTFLDQMSNIIKTDVTDYGAPGPLWAAL